MIHGTAVRIRQWLVLLLGLGAIALVASAEWSSASGAQSLERPAPEDDQETAASRDNPVRPQGPALDVPQEIVEMLQQRQRAIERREEAIRTEEVRLLALKKDLEQILARQQQVAKPRPGQNAKQTLPDAGKAAVDHVAKMYETMPPEEAAARLEKLPTDMALQVLRSLKGKTAGIILANVKPAKAAKLTERFLAGTAATPPPSSR